MTISADIIYFFVVFVVAIFTPMLFGKFLGIFTIQHLVVSVSIFFVLNLSYALVISQVSLKNQFYQMDLGKYERIVDVGGGRYPNATVKTSEFTLHEIPTNYLANIEEGDTWHYRVEAQGREIKTYYVIGGRRYGISSCYYPMVCWDKLIEKYDFVSN